MSSTLNEVTLIAPDISCAHCVATIKREIGALPGITAVEADIASKRVDFSYDPTRVSLAEIESAMVEAGYPVQQ